MDDEGPEVRRNAGDEESPEPVVADPRKFSDYVLVPGHPTGKDRVFLGLLGYRPRSAEDAVELAVAYVEQAEQRWESGEAIFSRANEHGRLFLIVVELRGVRIRSVWILRNNGELALVTPFRGFAPASG